MYTFSAKVERWGVQEVVMPGKAEGNPFTDVEVKGEFVGKEERKTVYGFYDGDGNYVIRFMPSFTGKYGFRIESSAFEEPYTGTFDVIAPSEGNHGPVRVKNTYHFAYEDGTPYYPNGTTCYVWELQSDELQETTLKTLSEGYFNKMRFCVFPKHYDYNQHEPWSYPYEGTPMDSSVLTPENFMLYNGDKGGNDFDFTRFNVRHFRHVEESILKLQELGIEADLILFHPYDRWGFSLMSHEQDILYLNYVTARFAAYRNVWWSFANEWDLMPQKSVEDWEDFAKTVMERDPYDHLRNIHNCTKMYDQTRPWITHVCCQRIDLYKTTELTEEYRQAYKKPIVWDEIAYEGNIQHGWGNIGPQELMRRFWEACVHGGYAGHGETYLSDDRVLWWSHGGVLKGESQDRIRFLQKIMNETPGCGLKKAFLSWDDSVAVPEEEQHESFKDYSYYLFYYGFFRPSFRDFYYFDDDAEFEAEIIDTWNMTVEKIPGVLKGKFHLDLPGREYMAVRLRRVN
ncbi:MAG: DUF5605 domain-containing protein [Lachnospiraceae bacterium]|nr:DUF5605 domain-containing protein [Lachnospiraceae bacterium]